MLLMGERFRFILKVGRSTDWGHRISIATWGMPRRTRAASAHHLQRALPTAARQRRSTFGGSTSTHASSPDAGFLAVIVVSLRNPTRICLSFPRCSSCIVSQCSRIYSTNIVKISATKIFFLKHGKVTVVYINVAPCPLCKHRLDCIVAARWVIFVYCMETESIV